MKNRIMTISLSCLLLFLGHEQTFAQNLDEVVYEDGARRQTENGGKMFDIAEQMPSFKGNVNQWLSQNLIYPVEAAEKGIQGRVILNFVVEKDGSISDVRVVRSVEPALDRAAVNVVRRMPKWNPAMNNGKPVRVRFTLPVIFKL